VRVSQAKRVNPSGGIMKAHVCFEHDWSLPCCKQGKLKLEGKPCIDFGKSDENTKVHEKLHLNRFPPSVCATCRARTSRVAVRGRVSK
jgi:hypothetical protein